jgi:hypothetical protein
MGLAVEVGVLAYAIENDAEGADWLRESFKSMNAVLAENGLPLHEEPEVLPQLHSRAPVLSYSYSFLHYLRRAAAYASEYPGWVAKPFAESSDPAADPLVAKHFASWQSHLLCHSDSEGFYLPIAFDRVIVDSHDRIPGSMLGSSIALQHELIAVAPALGIKLADGILSDDEVARLTTDIFDEKPLSIERIVWLSLFEAARLSMQYKAAIAFE